MNNNPVEEEKRKKEKKFHKMRLKFMVGLSDVFETITFFSCEYYFSRTEEKAFAYATGQYDPPPPPPHPQEKRKGGGGGEERRVSLYFLSTFGMQVKIR